MRLTPRIPMASLLKGSFAGSRILMCSRTSLGGPPACNWNPRRPTQPCGSFVPAKLRVETVSTKEKKRVCGPRVLRNCARSWAHSLSNIASSRCLDYVARSGAIEIVTDFLVIGGNRFSNRAGRTSNHKEPVRHFLSGADFGEGSKGGCVEIQGESALW